MEFKIGDRVTIHPESTSSYAEKLTFGGLRGIIINTYSNMSYPYEVRIMESCKLESGINQAYVFSYEELKLDKEYYRDFNLDLILN